MKAQPDRADWSLTSPPKPGFIAHLHGFRGFAIASIVMGHAVSTASALVGTGTMPVDASILGVANGVLFHGSTLYFTLISGLLFSAVLSGRTWTTFFSRKLRNVVSPYVVITLILSLLVFPKADGDARTVTLFAGGVDEYVRKAAASIVHGDALNPYWYMPVLCMLFVATPLLAAATGRPVGRRFLVLTGLLPLVISREDVSVNVNTTIYFLGAYALGILLGANYTETIRKVERLLPILTAVAVLTSLGIAAILLGGVGPWGAVSLQESLTYIQKLAISGVVIVLLHRHERALPAWLDTLAYFAFAIYFLHKLVMGPLVLPATALFPGQTGLAEAVLLALAFCILSIAASMLIALTVRAIFGRYSRMLVGA